MLKFDIPIAPVAQARPRAVNMANRRKYYRPGKPKIILHDPTNVKIAKEIAETYGGKVLAPEGGLVPIDLNNNDKDDNSQR